MASPDQSRHSGILIVTAVIDIERELATETAARHVVAGHRKHSLIRSPAKTVTLGIYNFSSATLFLFLGVPSYKGSISLRAHNLIVLS